MARIPGVRRSFRLPGAERDVRGAVDDEIAFHIDMLVEPSPARHSARPAAVLSNRTTPRGGVTRPVWGQPGSNSCPAGSERIRPR